VRIFNIWRPICHPAAHKPFAVSDWRSLDTQYDLVAVRPVYPDREGRTLEVRYNLNHHWYYLSNQTPEEVTLIKCYDSEVNTTTEAEACTVAEQYFIGRRGPPDSRIPGSAGRRRSPWV